MKVRASALYMVIVMALVISVLCSALIMVAYLFRQQFQRKFRVDRVHENVYSAMTLLLHDTTASIGVERTLDLFGDGTDSVSVTRKDWGVFGLGIVQEAKGQDTAWSVFTIAHPVDSAKGAALYIADEDRPVSLSGKTTISGNIFVPRAGLKGAYVDGRGYEGGEKLFTEKRFDSKRKLPELDGRVLRALNERFSDNASYSDLPPGRHLFNSFRRPVQVFGFQKSAATIHDRSISGNIILYSDSTLILDSSAVLKQCIVFAKTIKVRDGFHGSCQLFARDSILIGRNCHLDYPSCAGVFRAAGDDQQRFTKIEIGEKSAVNGLVFNYQKDPGQLLPVIFLEKDVNINGYVYCSGLVSTRGGCRVNGGAFCSRFLYRKDLMIYENYLIDIRLDQRALSKYYLCPKIMPFALRSEQKILEWFEKK